MATDRPRWLAELSTGFKRHRQGRTGWFVEVMRDRLRVVSSELPPRADEAADAPPKRRAFTLNAPPGPATAAAALAEACALFDAVMAGEWAWPDADGVPDAGDPLRLSPVALQRVVDRLQGAVMPEKVSESTWRRMYAPFMARLLSVAGERPWRDEVELLSAVLRHWDPNSRARQMAHDRYRQLWRQAGWEWPAEVAGMRGNGRAAADPEGVRAFTNAEVGELRARVQRSRRLTPGDLLAWDLLIAFGLRPKELQGLRLDQADGQLVARVTRSKRSSKGSSGARVVPAVPPAGWPDDCHGLLDRWERYGLPPGLLAARSPGEAMAQQLARLKLSKPVELELDRELVPYSLRHAFALRLATDLGLHPREAAAFCGHSPQTHMAVYGRRLDTPNLLAKVRRLQSESGSSGNISSTKSTLPT
jgi:integrase